MENEIKNNVEEMEEKKESNFLRLDVNPAGKRLRQLENGDYQLLCPRGLTIDGKDFTGYNTYLKADRLKDPKVFENSPDWVAKKLENGIKEVFFPKQFDDGKTYTVQLSHKDQETGQVDKVNVDAEKFVPAVIAQIKQNKAYAIEQKKEKAQNKEQSADKDDRNAIAAATPNEDRADSPAHVAEKSGMEK